MSEGLVFDIKRFSIHDGPGIRTTVFLKGCPLSCAWCHNPESQHPESELFYRASRCIVCGVCEDICPEGAIFASGAEYLTDSVRCKVCGKCTEACPGEARELVGRSVSLEEVVDEIQKDQLYYEESGGGVTISGGEPLMQPEFLIDLLRVCGNLGIHRAIDTSGLAEEQLLLKVADETELFLYDLKHTDPAKHIEFTGVSNERILSNLMLLAESNVSISVRVPLVSGFNDDDENLHKTAVFVRSLPQKCGISLLPFHKSAEEKHRRFGMIYNLQNGGEVTEARVEEISEIFASYGFAVRIGG